MNPERIVRVACPQCGHRERHSGGGIGVCLAEGCGCDDMRSPEEGGGQPYRFTPETVADAYEVPVELVQVGLAIREGVDDMLREAARKIERQQQLPPLYVYVTDTDMPEGEGNASLRKRPLSAPSRRDRAVSLFRRAYALVTGSLGYIGVALALIAYWHASDALFVVSAVPLATDAVRRRAWPFLALNLIWGGLALWRLT